MNLPHNLDVERAVLGAPLVVASAMDALADLEPRDFFLPAHQAIFEAYVSIRARGAAPDWVLVTDELKAREMLSRLEGGGDYITRLAKECPAAFTVANYVQKLAAYSARRKLIVAAHEIAAAAGDLELDVADVLEDACKKTTAITLGGAVRWHEFSTLIPEVLDDIHARHERFERTRSELSGIPFFVDGIDRMLLGCRRGELGIIAADTSAGKTSLAMQAMVGHVLHEGAGLVINMEMPAREIAERAIVWRARVDSRMVRAGRIENHRKPIVMAGADLMHANCSVKDDVNTMPKIVATCRQWRAKTRTVAGMIIVDFAQLIRGAPTSRMSRAQEIGLAAQELKSLAKELDVPIVLISQLNRVGVKSDRPSKSDLKESGDLENAADWIIIVHNLAEEPKGDDDVMFYIDKNRNGAKAQSRGHWYGKHYLFTDYGG